MPHASHYDRKCDNEASKHGNNTSQCTLIDASHDPAAPSTCHPLQILLHELVIVLPLTAVTIITVRIRVHPVICCGIDIDILHPRLNLNIQYYHKGILLCDTIDDLSV